MHLVYIDEVKKDRAQPFYWLCGLAIAEEDVKSVERAMNDLAQSTFGTTILSAQTEFHAREIFHGKGPFADIELPDRVELLKRLAGVVNAHPGIGRIQVRLDPDRIIREDYAHIAFMYLVERLDQLMKSRESLALLIVDHDKDVVGANVRDLSTFKESGTEFEYGRDIQRVVDTVHHTHSHHSRLLQLADAYVYMISMREQEHTKYPRQELVEYIDGLPDYVFPTKYKFWPPKSR